MAKHSARAFGRRLVAHTLVAVAVVITFVTFSHGAIASSHASSSGSAQTLAIVTLPPLIQFDTLEASPTPIPAPPTPVPSSSSSNRPLSPGNASSQSSASSPPDRVQTCMDRCVELHMSKEQAKANCMQSCLKQRGVTPTTIQATWDPPQEHGKASAAVVRVPVAWLAVMIMAVMGAAMCAGWPVYV